MSIIILVVSIISLTLGYIFYGSYVGRRLGIDPSRSTPAHTMYDGIDYCPAKAPVLFGHHFASIAGAAPIVGPIIAVAYGWLPVLLWLLVGGIFLGATHDFVSLIASVRHQGRSIGEVIGVNMGYFGKQLFLIFLWATLVLVIAVFITLVAKTFVAEPSAATASTLFIFLAIVFGVTVYRWKAPVLLASIVGIIFLAFCMIAGWVYPMGFSVEVWTIGLLVYIFIASVTPVWILLQPRDYLNSFLLYAVVLLAIIGVFVAHPAVNMPAFVAWNIPGLGPIFPVLFVTVACGAISGFHSIVASGTSAKQLSSEKDAKFIGYGAMLVETLVAVVATIFAVMLLSGDYVSMLRDEGPIAIFAKGTGKVLMAVGLPFEKSTSFAALAVSAFVLTSLDTATRLARFAFQEFFAPRKGTSPSILCRNRYVGTTITVVAGGALAWSGSWQAIWPIFGSANQLLAALAFLAVSVWLMRSGKKAKFVFIPMIVMFAITLTALTTLFINNYQRGNITLFAISLVLLAVSIALIIGSFLKMRELSPHAKRG